MKKIFSPTLYLASILSVLLLPQQVAQAQDQLLLFADWSHMLHVRKQYQGSAPETTKLVNKLIDQAKAVLHLGPFSVMDKDIVPVSGDKHDYVSQGPYWWPDKTKSDGLPYIRLDGLVNPEREKYTDRASLQQLLETAETLSAAYFYSGDEKFANRAISLLEVWFLDEETKMNPHLEYGQRIPGITEGRGIGIIETRRLGKIADIVELLTPSESADDTFVDGIKDWMKSYLDWLLHSDKGKDESVHPNNHGTWYNVQVCALAMFTGQAEIARSVLEESKARRLDAHIMEDGGQPREIARTKSFSYSAMNLQGLCTLAHFGEKLGVDLWHYENKHAATLRDALEYLLPAAMGLSSWPHKQISPFDPSRLHYPLILAAKAYQKSSYAQYARELLHEHDPNGLQSLFLKF